MNNEKTLYTALLHDVIEDTDVTFEKLELRGFSKETLDALKLLTHDDAEPYMDYVARIKDNRIAKCVKFADLKHNSDLSRLDIVDEKAKKRCEKIKDGNKALGRIKIFVSRQADIIHGGISFGVQNMSRGSQRKALRDQTIPEGFWSE